MTWARFPWLLTILNDDSDKIVFQKASQMGVSTYCILWLFWLARQRQANRGAIYWLPTDDSVSDFVHSKVDTLVNENLEQIHLRIGEQTNNVGLKFFFGVPCYFRGLKSKVGVKSISGDAAIYDEYDEADPAQIKQAEERLSASERRFERRLSIPTLPDYGINKDFELTDQCYFAFQCSACNNWNILEKYFPECFQLDKAGQYYHACQKCKNALDIRVGRWVKLNPNSELRGYSITQLYSPFITPNQIMHEFHTTEHIGHFYNHKIGIPYLAAEDKVTREQVLALCDSTMDMRFDSVASTFMGVDVGSVLNVIIILRGKERNRILFAGELKEFEELDRLISVFNVQQFVIDALPETRKARELVMRHKFKGWLCFYNDNQKGEYAWKEDERIVTVNRTESLDVGTLDVHRRKVVLPRRSTIFEKVADQFSNTAKVVEENKVTGAKKYVYKKLGPDHYRHAFNYAQIAASRTPWDNVISVFR